MKIFSKGFHRVVLVLAASLMLSACATPIYEKAEITPGSHKVRTPATLLNRYVP